MRKRIQYQVNGKTQHYTILNFSDLDRRDEEGKTISVNDVISEENNVFKIFQRGGKGGDLEFYRGLTGKEAVIMFCLGRDMTQEQVGDYFEIGQATVNRLRRSSVKKIKNIHLK